MSGYAAGAAHEFPAGAPDTGLAASAAKIDQSGGHLRLEFLGNAVPEAR